MVPIPIPDDLCGLDPAQYKRYVINPPDGDMTNDQIRSVEVVAAMVGDQVHISALVALEPGEVERLAAMPTPAVWFTMLTPQIPPFCAEVADGQDGAPSPTD